MSETTCNNSRPFSWLAKTCCPAPGDSSRTFSPLPAVRRTTTTSASISSLPDDLLLDILSRLPLSDLPSLPSVSLLWHRLLHSHSFLLTRRRHHHLRPTLFALSSSSISSLDLTLNLWQASSSSLLPPFSFSHARVASIGRKIYLIGSSSTSEIDAWTSYTSHRPAMLFSRKKFAAAAVDGQIYVAGGSRSELEAYDPERNTWSVVSYSPRKRYGCVGVGIDGVFYVIGGLKFGSTLSEAQAYACSMDLYDVESRMWLRSRAVPGGGCVVAACGADGDVYVLASHAVELSFWRFNARRGGGCFGEWSRMKGPPLPAQVRLDSTVRFACVGAESKVVLVQVMGCIDDLLRRSGRKARGYRGGLVLVFDCNSGEWSRAPDLPEIVSRAACACVEC